MLGYFISLEFTFTHWINGQGPDASTHTSYQVHTVKEQKTAMDAAFMRRGSISPKVACGNNRSPLITSLSDFDPCRLEGFFPEPVDP